MSLWGDKEVIANANGTITLANTGVVSGQSTTFTIHATEGDYIRISGREYRITAVTNNISMSVVAGPGFDIPDIVANTAYTLSEKPVYITASMTGTYANNVYFVDNTEITDANNIAHGIYGTGWMHVKSYRDSANNVRYKTELLVAMSGITAQVGDLGGNTNVDFIE